MIITSFPPTVTIAPISTQRSMSRAARLNFDDDESTLPHRARRKRKPSMADAARLAAKQGVEVKIAADGTVTVTPVKPLDITPTDNTETANPWDRLLQ
jgi:hypothetical protein